MGNISHSSLLIPHLDDGFLIRAMIKPKKIAAAIPAEQAVRPPVNAPNKPFFATFSSMPFARE